MRVISNIVLAGILLAAASLRLWNLGSVPPSTSMDEASIGYNAYSIVKTGVDEFGDFPFISQRGYDDWRRSTYLFLVAPFVGSLGLTSVAIRMPAVLLAVLTTWAVYGISMELFGRHGKFAHVVSLLVACLWATSPWHIYLSRIGHETNAYVSAALFGFYFFLRGTRHVYSFIPALVFFTVALISYYAGQVFIPIFGLGLFLLYYRDITPAFLKNRRFLIVFLPVFVVCIWIAALTFSPSAIVRFSGTSTFKPEAHWQEYTKRMERRQKAVLEGDVIGRIANSMYVFPAEVFVQAYSSHFRPKWLFFNSGGEPFKAPNSGLLYLWQLPFILIGLFAFLFNKDVHPKVKRSVFLWLLLANLPGGIATGAPHAMRTYPALFAWEVFTAFGIMNAIAFAKSGKVYVAGAILFLSLFGLGGFIRNYFVNFPYEQSGSFHYAFSRAIGYVLREGDSYEKIVFSNEENLYQSYMLFLYYSRYDPAIYRKEGGTDSGGYAQTHRFGKYEFRPIQKNEALAKGVLYVGNSDDFAPGAMEVARFANLDGTIAVKAAILP